MIKRNKQVLWLSLLVFAVLLLIGLLFTPLVSPPGVYKPRLLRMPYTLGMSLLISLLLLLLTWLASKVHPERNNS